MKQFCLALDLKDDAELISQYEAYHRDVWPEIKNSILQSGITGMEIYRTGNRLFMILETEDDFSFERKSEMDKRNDKVQQWETLMEGFQQRLPFGAPGEKWQLMKKIFSL